MRCRAYTVELVDAPTAAWPVRGRRLRARPGRWSGCSRRRCAGRSRRGRPAARRMAGSKRTIRPLPPRIWLRRRRRWRSRPCSGSGSRRRLRRRLPASRVFSVAACSAAVEIAAGRVLVVTIVRIRSVFQPVAPSRASSRPRRRSRLHRSGCRRSLADRERPGRPRRARRLRSHRPQHGRARRRCSGADQALGADSRRRGSRRAVDLGLTGQQDAVDGRAAGSSRSGYSPGRWRRRSHRRCRPRRSGRARLAWVTWQVATAVVTMAWAAAMFSSGVGAAGAAARDDRVRDRGVPGPPGSAGGSRSPAAAGADR